MLDHREFLSALAIHPLTSARWPDLERLFGERGACGCCWCMWLRLKSSAFERQKGEGNRQALKGIVDAGEVPGLLAYHDGEPIGWCSVGPREAYPVLGRSRTLKPVDEQPVWSIVCFFVDKRFRGRGVTPALIRAATQYARDHEATLVEGYPVDPRDKHYPPTFAWPGITRAFQKAGFVEVLRRSETRPIMRYTIAG